MKFLAGLIGGLVLAVLGMLLVTVTFGAAKEGAFFGASAFGSFWLGGLVIAITAPRAGKSWRRLFLSSAVVSFLLPLAGLVYTGTYMASNTSGGAEAAGAAIGGGLISGALGFIGFFLGVVFLILGLVVGRDPQIVYMQPAPTFEP